MINKKDIEICKELIDEYNIDFESTSLNEMDNIEDLSKCNIYIFGCNKYLTSKKFLENL